MQQSKKDVIEQLRRDILLQQGYKPLANESSRFSGLEQVEAAFPNGVLPTGMLHEFLGMRGEQSAVTGGFIAGLLSSLITNQNVCLWVSVKRTLFPPALKTFGIEPNQIIFIDASREKEVLWIAEEALKCSGFTAVIAELNELSFTQSKRLQLAIEQSHVTGFLLRTDPDKLNTTTCAARWRITALPTQPEQGLPGLGFPRWNVELLRVRNGQPGMWQIEWRGDKFISLNNEVAAAISSPHKIRKAG
jgi:protein ImuA